MNQRKQGLLTATPSHGQLPFGHFMDVIIQPENSG